MGLITFCKSNLHLFLPTGKTPTLDRFSGSSETENRVTNEVFTVFEGQGGDSRGLMVDVSIGGYCINHPVMSLPHVGQSLRVVRRTTPRMKSQCVIHAILFE